MKHFMNYVSVPIDKGTISLKTKPRSIPWVSSSRNEGSYINYYNSFLEVTVRIIFANAITNNAYLLLKKPHNCLIEKMDGNFSFIDPQSGQEMGLDVSENIMDESFYRAALDYCFCNKDKQLLDDFCPCWLGMNNYYDPSDNKVFDNKITDLDIDATNKTMLWKCRVPIRLLSGFAARNAFLNTRNFVCKLYFNDIFSMISQFNNGTATKDFATAEVTSVDVTNIDFYYDMTLLGTDESDLIDPQLLNIPQTKIERGLTTATLPSNADQELRIKFNDTLNFSPKLMVLFITDENNNMADLMKLSPTYFKISTGGETNLNPSMDPDSNNQHPDYRLWAQTKQGLDKNNQPCMDYTIWKLSARFYVYSFAENFNLLENNNYINYELRFKTDATYKDQKINIHRVYLKDYLSVFETEA